MSEISLMVRTIAALLSIFLICVSKSLPQAAEKVPERPMSICLEAVDKTIKRGTVPKFRLSIRNEGSALERVIDLRGGRSDLQDTYYKLEVTQDGRPLNLPRSISDPGPVSDKDFVTLRPSEKVTFELTRFAIRLEELPPGKYKARVRFWQDSQKSSKTRIFSTPAEFLVEE